MSKQDNNKIIGQYTLDFNSSIKFLGQYSTVVFKDPPLTKNFSLTCGNNSYAEFGEGARLQGKFHVGDDCKLYIGSNLQCNWAVMVNAEEKTTIRIGNDCLFSDISIYSSDSHSIFDLQEKKRINFAADVTLGDRVWLARRVMIAKGVTIGSDVVVGAASLVTKNIPSNSVCAGNPAKVLKEGIGWVQERTITFPNKLNKVIEDLTINEIDSLEKNSCQNYIHPRNEKMNSISIIDAEVAYKNVHGDAIYPSPKRGSERLLNMPLVGHIPKFTIDKETKIFAIGSCFARNIERYLLGSGFNVVSNEFAKYIDGDASIQNKYNSASIRQDLEAALGNIELVEKIKLSFIETDNGCENLHFGGGGAIAYKTIEDLTNLSDIYINIVKKIQECDVIIITLGLVEVWYDKIADCYLNIGPSKAIVKKFPGRYELRVQSYEGILNDLNAIYTLLQDKVGDQLKILITVSPVPLHATFRGQDVLQANSYSKSVLRAATEEFIMGKENVSYFPSYEIVTLASREKAWIASDFRHVNAEIVAHIMSNFLDKYVGGMQLIPSKEKIQLMFQQKKYQEIVENVSELFKQNVNYWNNPRPQFLYVNYFYAQACMRLIVKTNDKYQLIAEEQFERIYESNPLHFSSALALAKLKIKSGFKSDALKIIDEVLIQDKDYEPALNLKLTIKK